MKSARKVIVLLLAVIFAASVLTACGGGGGGASATGYFILSEMKTGTETISQDQLSLLGESYVVLEGGGKGYVVMMGEQNDVAYTDSKMTIEGSEMDYRIDGDKLVLSEGSSDYSMTFTKSNDAPPAKK